MAPDTDETNTQDAPATPAPVDQGDGGNNAPAEAETKSETD